MLIGKEGVWVVREKALIAGGGVVSLWSISFWNTNSKKVYSDILDDEDDPAEAEKEGNEMEGEELDPLDAYMEEVKEEVKKFNMRSVKGGGGNEKVWNFLLFLKIYIPNWVTWIHWCIDLLLTCMAL